MKCHPCFPTIILSILIEGCLIKLLFCNCFPFGPFQHNIIWGWDDMVNVQYAYDPATSNMYNIVETWRNAHTIIW